jgi:hypothetical protein
MPALLAERIQHQHIMSQTKQETTSIKSAWSSCSYIMYVVRVIFGKSVCSMRSITSRCHKRSHVLVAVCFHASISCLLVNVFQKQQLLLPQLPSDQLHTQ